MYPTWGATRLPIARRNSERDGESLPPLPAPDWVAPRYHKHLPMGGVFFLFMILLAQAQGATEDHASPASAPAHLLRDYLEGPPWLRKMVFRWPRNMYPMIIDPEQHIEFRPTGWAHFEAAVQPQGWYLRHLEGSPDYDIKRRGKPPEPWLPPKGKETVVGANSDFYWYLGWGHEILRLIPREGQPGYHPRNSFLFRAHFDRTNYIESARLLGFYWLSLLQLQLQWDQPDHFVGESSQGTTAEGRITRWTADGRPARWECTVQPSQGTPWRFWVEYRYAPDRFFPPSEFTLDGTALAREPITHTFYIDAFEPGVDGRFPEGYEPEQFRAIRTPYESLTISSNAVLYRIDAQGNWISVDTSPPVLPVEARQEQWLRGIVLVVAVGAGLILGGAWLRHHRRRAVRGPSSGASERS